MRRTSQITCFAKLGTGMALALGALSGSAQTYPTNYINFADAIVYSLDAGNSAELSGAYPSGYTNLDPNGITMTLGFQMYSHTNNGPSPLGSIVNIDAQGGSKITFSSPVVLWSMEIHSLWSQAQVEGRKGGTRVWSFTAPGAWEWDNMTNGAGIAVDEIDFVGNWNARYTDLFIQDAAGIVTPLLSAFGVMPETLCRGQGVPVNLTWAADPTATITIDNSIGDVTAYMDPNTGAGSIAVSPTNTTTYTITAQSGAKTASKQVTVQGSILPPEVGLMTFEDRTPGMLPQQYSWNTPVGVYTAWNNWAVAGGTGSGTPLTANAVWPVQWGDLGTNSLGMTNQASIQFLDVSSSPLPVMLNSFAVSLDTNMFALWGPIRVEARLAGVLQWSWDGSEATQWENIITKGAGIPVDEVDFAGYFYQYDNFAISTTNFLAPPAPSLMAPATQNGQLQFSWNSVADWADYAILKKDVLTDKWYPLSQTAVAATAAGTTNTYTVPAVNTEGFFRVLRVP